MQVLGELNEVIIKTSTADYSDTGATDIQAEICQDRHCCSMSIGPMANGASDRYDGDNLSDCRYHELIQSTEDNVTVTFSTTSTDGWLGDYAQLNFTTVSYYCPIDGWVDHPDSATYRSTCSLSMSLLF